MTPRKRSSLSRKKSRETRSEGGRSISSTVSHLSISDVQTIVGSVNSPEEACALIEAVPCEYAQSQALVSALEKKFPEKVVTKSAKRLAFKLRNAGIEVEPVDAAADSDSALTKERFKDELSAFMGPILDLSGSRAVLITNHSPVKGIHAGMGMVSPATGMQDFIFGPLPKKLLSKMEQEIDSAAGPLVEVEISVFFRIMDDAYNSGSQGAPAALAYKELRPLILKNVQPHDGPLHGSLREQSRQTADIFKLSQAEELFSNTPLNLWVPEDPAITSFIDQIKEAQDSPLLLSNSLRKGREQEIKDKLALEIFPPARRDFIADILYETAYFYQKRGEDRLKNLSLSAARVMDEDKRGVSNAVIDLLLSRALKGNLNQPDGGRGSEEEQKNDIIISP